MSAYNDNQKDSKELLSLARNKFIEGLYHEAENIIQQILPHNNEIPEVYQMLATIYYNKGQFNKAIKTFRKALELDPDYTDASVGLSIILNDLGRYNDAQKVFLDAQQRLDKRNQKNDSYINDRLAQKFEEIADLCFQTKRFAEAIENLDKAVNLSPQRKDLPLRIVDCLLKLGESDKAFKKLKNIIKDEPKNLQARNKLAVFLYNKNQVAEAVQEWEHILSTDPRHSEAKRYLRIAKNAGVTDASI